jgi:alkylation response protein AidB-like acyl-CoA dehydrogenase
MWNAEIPICCFGTEEQKKRYLPRLISGEWVGTRTMTGSDHKSVRTHAERHGNSYVLNGSETFITNATNANLVLVLASLTAPTPSARISAFIVEVGTPGFIIRGKQRKMGLRTSPMADLCFADCAVPEENLLGEEEGGDAILAASVEWERICVLASYLGTMQRLLENSVEYARERKQFGQAIGKFSAVADKIANMELRLEAGRLLLYKAAWLKSQGGHPIREASIAKLYLSEACVQTCLDAIQIHGGYGYMTEYHIERELRDAISAETYSGSSEVQRMNIASLHGL